MSASCDHALPPGFTASWRSFVCPLCGEEQPPGDHWTAFGNAFTRGLTAFLATEEGKRWEASLGGARVPSAERGAQRGG